MSRKFRSIHFLLATALLAAAPVISSATYAERNATGARTNKPAPAKPAKSPAPQIITPVHTNPLLPRPIAPEGFFPDLSLLQKLPTIAPQGFDPLYTAEDWQAYRTRFGVAADDLPKKKSSGVTEFATSLITAAESETETPGLRRLLLFRAAAVCYRNSGGFPTANRAVTAYQKIMDLRSPAQVGALWTITNQMSRMAVTPKPERIRYSAIAARANTQLALLMLENDQVEAAQNIIKLVGYHEGWLKSDPPVRAIIAQTRAVVRQTAVMMDFLQTQYQPAINGDDAALMNLYLYGQFVKRNPALVADFPSRKPNSPMAHLARSLSEAEKDPSANYTAAETLRLVATNLPDGLLKQRTLYASLERYRTFIRAPETEKERVKRTLAQMAIEAAVADGAKPGITIRPFDPPRAEATTQPATAQPATAHLATTMNGQ